MTEDQIIDRILRAEGSTFTHDPADRGGPTRHGITLRRLRQWRKDSHLTAHDVEALTRAEAREIYRSDYIVAPGFDRLSEGDLRLLLVDYGVLHGTRTAIRALQRILRVTTDGVLGPITRAALRRSSETGVYYDLVAARMKLIVNIVVRDPTQLRFLRGWTSRVMEYL